MLNYISVQQAADKWGISERKIQKLCEENRIAGAIALAMRGRYRRMRQSLLTAG